MPELCRNTLGELSMLGKIIPEASAVWITGASCPTVASKLFSSCKFASGMAEKLKRPPLALCMQQAKFAIPYLCKGIG